MNAWCLHALGEPHRGLLTDSVDAAHRYRCKTQRERDRIMYGGERGCRELGAAGGFSFRCIIICGRRKIDELCGAFLPYCYYDGILYLYVLRWL